jgi:hypothetical protein
MFRKLVASLAVVAILSLGLSVPVTRASTYVYSCDTGDSQGYGNLDNVHRYVYRGYPATTAYQYDKVFAFATASSGISSCNTPNTHTYTVNGQTGQTDAWSLVPVVNMQDWVGPAGDFVQMGFAYCTPAASHSQCNNNDFPPYSLRFWYTDNAHSGGGIVQPNWAPDPSPNVKYEFRIEATQDLYLNPLWTFYIRNTSTNTTYSHSITRSGRLPNQVWWGFETWNGQSTLGGRANAPAVNIYNMNDRIYGNCHP